MYESLLRFPGDILGEFERLQREMEQVFGGVGRPVSIRALGRGPFRRSPSAIGPMRSRSGRWHRASTRASSRCPSTTAC
jgi:hypothetical protein